MYKIDNKLQKVGNELVEIGASDWLTTDVIDQLEPHSKDKNLEQLRHKTTEILRRMDPNLAESYEALSRLKVRTSDQRIDSFDKQRIVDSLLKETNLPRGIAEKIAKEVELELKTLNAKIASSLLIREIVSAKLIQYGFEAAQADYSRIGLPVYDLNNLLIEQTPQQIKNILSNTVISQYTLMKVLPTKISDSHLSGRVEIKDLDTFPTQILSYALEYTDKARENLLKARKYVTRNIVLTPGGWLKNKDTNAIINILTNDGKAPIHCLNQEEIPRENTKLILKEDSSINQLANKNITLINSKKETILPQPRNNFIQDDIDSGGILTEIVLNLPKLAFESKGSQSRFQQKIIDHIDLAQRTVSIKKARLERTTLNEFLLTDELYYTLGLYGLENAIYLITEEKAHENPEALKIAETILKEIKANLEDDHWLISNEDNHVPQRFIKANEEIGTKSLNTEETINTIKTMSKLGKYYTGGQTIITSTLEHLEKALKENYIKQIMHIPNQSSNQTFSNTN